MNSKFKVLDSCSPSISLFVINNFTNFIFGKLRILTSNMNYVLEVRVFNSNSEFKSQILNSDFELKNFQLSNLSLISKSLNFPAWNSCLKLKFQVQTQNSEIFEYSNFKLRIPSSNLEFCVKRQNFFNSVQTWSYVFKGQALNSTFRTRILTLTEEV